MYKRHPFPIFIIFLLVASLACGQFGGASAPLDPNAQATSVQQTVVARQTEAVLNNPPTLTPTIGPPTLTFTPAFTSTPLLTDTPSVPQVSVSLDTNCREGPGKTFENVGSLLVGESTDVIAGEPKGEYWYVRNPDNPTGYCWLWGEYATFTGNIYILPIYTPPPPSTTSFTVTYSGIETCNTYWIDFKLENESDATFKSISITLEDSTTNPKTVASAQTNGFINNDACSGPARKETLGPQETTIVSSPAFSYNPAGHNIKGKVILCTELNQTGTCITKENDFKP
jgi:hypothetical protein